MEALAAISLTSNIFQFVGIGFKLLAASREFYGTGKEIGQSNRDLGLVTQEMKRLSLKLAKDASSKQCLEDYSSLIRLATECARSSDDLLALLSKLENQKPNSRRHAWRTAIRNMRKQDERTQLEKDLDNYRKQIDIEFASLTRSETLHKLDSIVSSTESTKEEISRIKENTALIRQALQSAYISDGALDGLQRLLQISEKPHQKSILAALWVKGMQDRFYDVAKAHADTFEWILELPQKPQAYDFDGRGGLPSQSSLPTDIFRQKANTSFVDWLRHGRGIYHISGKPGAGKSTLMKFLSRDPRTMQYLQTWSGGKTLVFAKSFFWRLGRNAQKSLSGLIRSLLYQVLSGSPELLPVAFPRRWSETDSPALSDVGLDRGDVEEAFDLLMRSDPTFQSHKFAFFIDGLDEYEGRHIDIVRQFFDWCSLHPENVKICVSSREWNEFMVGFEKCPKLRIHECTEKDITQFVTDKLDAQCQYLTLVSNDELESLAKEIVRKAEGAFIWVRLVLTAVEDGVLNGDDASDLQAKVASFPNELEGLYQYLFDSIRGTDRPKAFEMLRLAHHIRRDQGLPLLRYWFLNEANANPSFALAMPIAQEPADVSRHLNITRRQIYGRCKGFLEVYPPRAWQTAEDGEVKYMHSTVHEFLQKDHIRKIIDDTVGHVDFLERTCQTFLATIKFGAPDAYYTTEPDDPDSIFNSELSSIMDSAARSKLPVQRWFIDFLNKLDVAAAAALSKLKLTAKYTIIWAKHPVSDYSYQYLRREATQPGQVIETFAIGSLLHEYLAVKDPEYLLSLARPASEASYHSVDLVTLLLGALGYIEPLSYEDLHRTLLDYDRLYFTCKLAFECGVTPNCISQTWEGFSMFECFMHFFLFSPYSLVYGGTEAKSVAPLRLIYLCLRHGARSTFQLEFGPTYRQGRTNSTIVQVDTNLARSSYARKGRRLVPQVTHIPTTLPLVALAKERNWIVNLGDLLAFWFPGDGDELRSMLDNNNGSGDSSAIAPRPGPQLLQRQDESSRDWAAVELGEQAIPSSPRYNNIPEGYELVEQSAL
ncbi:Uu.00g145840.m01.CDS01 [Anthostomella pinea]|uniref:Uu.00g145840.m01.CDS01 n=1 Tax=Anthostomella pinea TaxID=933095 RepID=A0AAI8YLS4_9PEZI|nr:Uu.00g145840.m01.CDS01 [Anthostomella pinea]